MKKSACVLVMMVFLCCVMVAALPAHGQNEKVIRLKFANFFPATSGPTMNIENWCKEVEKRTNGRVKVSLFSGATLAPIGQSYDCVIRGIADISVTSPHWMTGRFPLSDVMYLPLGSSNSYQAAKMLSEWYKKFTPKEYDDVKVMDVTSTPVGAFMTLKPLPSVKDLKDLKIKAAGRTAPIISAVGAIPVAAQVTEIYEHLLMGVAEGALLPIDSLIIFKIGELVKGLQINQGLSYPSPVVKVMNKAKWNSLPADVKKIIEAINDEYVEKVAKYDEEIVKKSIEFGVSRGMKVFTIQPEEVEMTRKMMKPIFDDYVKRMKEKGLPGEESIKFCLDYIKAHK